jgi:exo-1,4-beta-D-glucosaminidase
MTRVAIANPSPDLAFFVRLELCGEDGVERLPVFWEDNYLSLLPGERRTLTARTRGDRGKLQVRASGWNVDPSVG